MWQFGGQDSKTPELLRHDVRVSTSPNKWG